jgi:hypothetical protein
MRQDVLSAGSYISSNDKRAHFGLGKSADAGTAEIHWPSGAVEKVRLPAPDRIYSITEGEGITGALCDGKPCQAPKEAGSPATHSSAASPSPVAERRLGVR